MNALKTTLKIIGYGVGGVVLYLLAQEYPAITYGITAAAAVYVLSELVKGAVRQVLQEELQTLRDQSRRNAKRIEEIDQKVSATWERIRQIGGK